MVLDNIKPMLATLWEPFDDPGFLYEIKWDGFRCIAYLDGNTRLVSRNFKEYTEQFPELRDLHLMVDKPGTVLDGEIVTFRDGKPSFLRLQPRLHSKSRVSIAAQMSKSPAVFVAFDILVYNGKSQMPRPFSERHDLLDKVLNRMSNSSIQISELVSGQGLAFFEAVKSMGLEGMVGKAADSPYVPGKRSTSWRKVKALRQEPFAICGYTTNPTGRSDLSALALCGIVNSQLYYFGLVGSGLSQGVINTLLRALIPIRVEVPPALLGNVDPPSTVQWVLPSLVCTVEYLELTGDNHLRHPVYKGLLPGKGLQDCIKD